MLSGARLAGNLFSIRHGFAEILLYPFDAAAILVPKAEQGGLERLERLVAQPTRELAKTAGRVEGALCAVQLPAICVGGGYLESHP